MLLRQTSRCCLRSTVTWRREEDDVRDEVDVTDVYIYIYICRYRYKIRYEQHACAQTHKNTFDGFTSSRHTFMMIFQVSNREGPLTCHVFLALKSTVVNVDTLQNI